MTSRDVFHELIFAIVPVLTMLVGIAQEWLFLEMSSLVIVFVASSGIHLTTVPTFVIKLTFVRFHVNAETISILIYFAAVDLGACLIIYAQGVLAYHFLVEISL